MRAWPGISAVVVTASVVLAGCGTEPQTTEPTAQPSRSSSQTTAEHPAGAAELTPVTVEVPEGLDDAPLDQPRQALVPDGWTLEVVARVPKARMAAWAPDGALLVSVPSTGEVLKVLPTQSTLLDGLDQPHGLFFAGPTLYVAESDQIDAYDYADGAAVNRRTVIDGLPDAKSPDRKSVV